MKRKCIILCVLLSLIFTLSACSNKTESRFSIDFIDVGQGDAALIECDGKYMLIDGGDKSAGNTIYQFLEERTISHLDILAISHLHEDHFGGLSKALTYATSIDIVLSNSTDTAVESFLEFNHQLGINGNEITVPSVGDKYKLGSSEVEIIDVSNENDNDSLVIMITYGKNKFLFTGDIEENAQTRLSDKYQNDSDKAYKVDLIKMPHHGAKINTTYRLLRTFTPDYAIISVGENNRYGHPAEDTLSKLSDSETQVYRTDHQGTIHLRSDGKNIEISTEK